jgi:hypothetical protein
VVSAGRALAVVVIAAAVWSGCRTATQVTVVVSTDARCTDVRGTLVVVGQPGAIETKAGASSATTCDPVTGHIGALVVFPSGADDTEVGIKVVTGIGQPPEACVAPDYKGGCIVARRSVRFIPHTAFDLPVVMQVLCKDVPCGATETCSSGRCVPAEVPDPLACADPAGCASNANGDAGGGADGNPGQDGAGPDGSPVGDAAIIDGGAADAPADAPATTGTLLVADTVANIVYLVDTRGKLLNSFPSPIAGVTGVAFDRRLHDGTFWITHNTNTNPILHQLGPTGVATGQTVSYGNVGAQGVRGLDFALAPAAAADQIVIEYTSPSSVDGFDGVVIATGLRDFSSGWTPDATTFNSGYWGIAMISYTPSTGGFGAASRWGTRGGSLEKWADKVGPPSSVVPLTTTASRGIAMTPAGDLYVSDAAAGQILHLDATGKQIETIPSPTANPAGISYAP